MRLLNTWCAKDRVTKTIVTSPSRVSQQIHREAHRTLHALWWCLTRYDEAIDVISALKVLSVVIVLCLETCEAIRHIQRNKQVPTLFFTGRDSGLPRSSLPT